MVVSLSSEDILGLLESFSNAITVSPTCKSLEKPEQMVITSGPAFECVLKKNILRALVTKHWVSHTYLTFDSVLKIFPRAKHILIDFLDKYIYHKFAFNSILVIEYAWVSDTLLILQLFAYPLFGCVFVCHIIESNEDSLLLSLKLPVDSNVTILSKLTYDILMLHCQLMTGRNSDVAIQVLKSCREAGSQFRGIALANLEDVLQYVSLSSILEDKDVPYRRNNVLVLEADLVVSLVLTDTVTHILRGVGDLFHLLHDARERIEQIDVIGCGSKGSAQDQNLRDHLTEVEFEVVDNVDLTKCSHSIAEIQAVAFTTGSEILVDKWEIIFCIDTVLLWEIIQSQLLLAVQFKHRARLKFRWNHYIGDSATKGHGWRTGICKSKRPESMLEEPQGGLQFQQLLDQDKVSTTVLGFVANSMRFDLKSGSTKCISEDIKSNSMTMGKYSVVNPNEGYPLPDAHKITVRVSTPSGDAHHVEEHVDSGHFAFVAHEAGDYTTCFATPDHKPETLTTREFDWTSGVAAKDWSNVAKKGKINVMELELKKLNDMVTSIHDEMFYLREREEEMQDLNRSTNSRMAGLSFLSLLVCLSVAGFQFWHLKTYFERKKLLLNTSFSHPILEFCLTNP